jgi:hypothetical protein
MSTEVVVQVEDVAALLAATYAEITLHSAASVAGSYSEVDTADLVAGTFFYTIDDPNGDLNTWYKYRFTGASGAAPIGEFSNPFQLDGVTRKRIRQHTIEDYEAGMVLAATSGGSTTSIPTTDSRFKSSAFNTDRGKGGWLHFTTGLNAGESRKVTASDPGAGTFTVNPAFSNAPTSGDEFEWHWLARPDQADAAINRAMPRYWFLERVPIVGVAGQKEYSLSFLPWLRNREDVFGLWHYPYSADEGGLQDEPWPGLGRWFRVRHDTDALTLMITPAVDETKTLYLEAARQMDALHTDASVARRNCDLRLISALTYDEVLAALTRPGTGASADRETWRAERIRHATQELRQLLRENRVNPRPMPPQTEEPPVVPQTYKAR